VVQVALGLVELHFGEVDSLKGKRHVLRGLKERVKHRFNVSIAEVDHGDLWQRATLAVALHRVHLRRRDHRRARRAALSP
jgi:uncharacterized protein YlxP (DUF503 family)